jgi:hypothetical protein
MRDPRQYSICASAMLVSGLMILQPAFSGEPLTPEEASRYAELEARQLQDFTNVDLADYLRLRNKQRTEQQAVLPIGEEIVHYALKASRQTFRFNARRFDLSESDCVVFVERSLAMALATDWPAYYRISERLRHRDGMVEYRNRNFHTLGDWLPNNAWLLETPQLETSPTAPVAAPFTHEVRPKVFEEFPAAPGSQFTRIIFKGSDYSSPLVEQRHDMYIPKHRLHEVISELLTGDVALILTPTRNESLGCRHMGFVHRSEDGEVYFLSSDVPSVRRQLLSGPEVNRGIKGFMFLRVRQDARAIVAKEVELLDATVAPPDPVSMDQRVLKLRGSGEG